MVGVQGQVELQVCGCADGKGEVEMVVGGSGVRRRKVVRPQRVGWCGSVDIFTSGVEVGVRLADGCRWLFVLWCV